MFEGVPHAPFTALFGFSGPETAEDLEALLTAFVRVCTEKADAERDAADKNGKVERDGVRVPLALVKKIREAQWSVDHFPKLIVANLGAVARRAYDSADGKVGTAVYELRAFGKPGALLDLVNQVLQHLATDTQASLPSPQGLASGWDRALQLFSSRQEPPACVVHLEKDLMETTS